MTIREQPFCKKIIGKKIDDNTFEFIDVYDLSHPECPIVVIDSCVDVVNQQSEELKVIE